MKTPIYHTPYYRALQKVILDFLEAPMSGQYRDNGKDNEHYYIMIGYILGGIRL